MPAGSFGLADNRNTRHHLPVDVSLPPPPMAPQPTRQTCADPTPSSKAAYDALHLDDFVPADRPSRVTCVMFNQNMANMDGL